MIKYTKILLANPRGFCAGVNRAINIVKNVLEIYGTPIYVYHEIVHNSYVTKSFSENGVIFTEKINTIPNNSVLVFPAHGVSKIVQNEAKSRNLTIFDATCPLVKRIHRKVNYASINNEESIIIGHAEHPEVKGTIGQYDNPKYGIYLVESIEDVFRLDVKNKDKLSFVTQTTLSVKNTRNIISALRKRFPKIAGPYADDICYATVNRQKAVRALVKQVDMVFVVGSKNSSNANRLVELAQNLNKPAFLIDQAIDIREDCIKDAKCIGITSGASVPDVLVKDVVLYLQKLNKKNVKLSSIGTKENIYFKMPKELNFKN